ncbi:MAG: amino acid lyase [Bacteroidales bacterium]|nr:amino acid lyase [Bacteroidales bacterium]
MISFTCDYNEGVHPDILNKLIETNLEQMPGYGDDRFTVSAIEKIRRATACPEADVFLLVGGTQTNATVIDAVIPHYAAVIAASTGHIAVHESGAVELGGHKVITLPQHDGKMRAEDLKDYMSRFYADASWAHMAHPEMVYLSFPSEYGTIYSRRELEAIRDVCKEYELTLFVDGARLGYGLASPEADLDLPALAQLCDVFYIGGTKVGALCGEAVVFPRGNAPKHMFTIVKQHGALMAKGRLLGIQFDTLFTDDLYMRISHYAIDRAMELQEMFRDKNIPLFIQSPTNQQFPVLTAEQMNKLEGKVAYEVWDRFEDGRAVTRFATSWATPEKNIKELSKIL